MKLGNVGISGPTSGVMLCDTCTDLLRLRKQLFIYRTTAPTKTHSQIHTHKCTDTHSDTHTYKGMGTCWIGQQLLYSRFRLAMHYTVKNILCLFGFGVHVYHHPAVVTVAADDVEFCRLLLICVLCYISREMILLLDAIQDNTHAFNIITISPKFRGTTLHPVHVCLAISFSVFLSV